MKVKNLIEKLKLCDQEAIVCTLEIYYDDDLVPVEKTYYSVATCVEDKTHFNNDMGLEEYGKIVIIHD